MNDKATKHRRRRRRRDHRCCRHRHHILQSILLYMLHSLQNHSNFNDTTAHFATGMLRHFDLAISAHVQHIQCLFLKKKKNRDRCVYRCMRSFFD